MGRASDWLKLERRRTLGDWVALCPGCGHAQRYFEDFRDELPEACPACGERLVTACPACGAAIPSVFAVRCEGCAEPLRPETVHGVPIRRSSR